MANTGNDISDLREEVWSAMLTADYNSRYWEYMYKRYFRGQKWAEIFLAIASSSSVAAWGIWSDIDVIWKVLSGASTLIAVMLPILNWKKQIADLADLLSRWTEIHAEYDLQWFDIEHTTPSRERVIEQFKKLKRREIEVDKITSNVPDDKKLLEQTRLEVISATTENNTEESK